MVPCMVWSLFYFWFVLFSLQMNFQLFQQYLLKRLLISALNCLYIFVENQFSIYVWVYLWSLLYWCLSFWLIFLLLYFIVFCLDLYYFLSSAYFEFNFLFPFCFLRLTLRSFTSEMLFGFQVFREFPEIFLY